MATSTTVINRPLLAVAPDFNTYASSRPGLGQKIGKPDALRGGFAQTYQNATVYCEFGSSPHEVHGAIRDLYLHLGGAEGWLGFPQNDETATPDGKGRFNHFEHGSIYWSPATGAHEVHGAIRVEWATMGFERSRLGYPTTDELPAPDGRISHFEHGSISWTAGGGAVATAVSPAIKLRGVAYEGRFIEVVGAGFTPNQAVKLGYDISSGGSPTTHQTSEVQVASDSAGGFTYRIKVNLAGDIATAQALATDIASGATATGSI